MIYEQIVPSVTNVNNIFLTVQLMTPHFSMATLIYVVNLYNVFFTLVSLQPTYKSFAFY